MLIVQQPDFPPPPRSSISSSSSSYILTYSEIFGVELLELVVREVEELDLSLVPEDVVGEGAQLIITKVKRRQLVDPLTRYRL